MVKIKRTVVFGSESRVIIRVLGITCDFQKIDGRLICNKSKEAQVYDPNELWLPDDIFDLMREQARAIMSSRKRRRQRAEKEKARKSREPNLWPELQPR